MLNFHGARTPMRRKTEESPSGAHLLVSYHYSLPVYRAAGSRIPLANSSPSGAAQNDYGISTPGFDLMSRGSAFQIFVYVFGSSMVRLNWMVLRSTRR